MDGHVRLATPEDAAAVRSILAPFVESTPISFEIEPPTVAETRNRIEETLRTHPWLVYEIEETVVGYAAASALRPYAAYDWAVELSVYVDDGARRAGVGTALYESIFEILTVQGFVTAYAATRVPNPATTNFHEAVGFESVGTFPAVGYKLGEWHDVQWWCRPVQSRPADPEPPTPLAELRDDPRLPATIQSQE